MMYVLAKSMLNYALELSVAGADQLLNAFSPIEPGQMSRTAMTVAPRHMTKLMTSLLHQLTEMIGDWMPVHDSRLAWQECTNKVCAFDTFEHVDVAFDLSSNAAVHEVALPALVQRANALGPYAAIWATEGLGRYYAERHWEQGQMPRDILTSKAVAELPDWSLIPLHTGMGLSLAERVLNNLPAHCADNDIDAMLRQFTALCQANSREGYARAAMEALGLVTRLLYPALVRRLDQQLSALEPSRLGDFWHGVGRGIYFLPINVPPGIYAAPRAVPIALGEPPHQLGRLNALAGLVWAITLVNIRHPEILAQVMQRHRETFLSSEAFANGVSSAILVWRDIKCDDPYLDAFCRYEPDPDDPDLVKLWRRLVREPCALALHAHYGALKNRNGFGDLFHYQSQSDLVEQLKGKPLSELSTC